MLSASVLGQAFWSPAWHDWAHAAPALRGEAAPALPPTDAPNRPNPTLLATNERRRAPDSVRMALQVAQDAIAAAGLSPAELPSVFTSAHGDLAIVDALCRTLADNPLLLSPMRFHHSVHNAASGYWAIGCRSHEASTAVAGGAHSFAAGLLEALTQVACEDRPVLLVGCDTEAMGPLQSVNHSRGLLAVALVLAPSGGRRIGWRLDGGAAQAPVLHSAAAVSLRSNAMADALPLFEALADSSSTNVELRLSSALSLALALDAT